MTISSVNGAASTTTIAPSSPTVTTTGVQSTAKTSAATVVTISSQARALAAASTQTYTVASAIAAYKSGGLSGAINITDASTGIAANLSDLSAMAHDGKILNITFNNASPGVSIDRLSISGSLADSVTLLRSIKSNYSLKIQNLSASEAASVNTLASNAKTTFTIKDDAATVTSNLATFQTYAQSKKLTSITLNDQTADQKKQIMFDAVTTAGRNWYGDAFKLPSAITTFPNLLTVNASQLTSAKTTLALLAPGSFKLVVTSQSASNLNNIVSDKRIAAFTLADTASNLNKNMSLLMSANKDKLFYVNPTDNMPIAMTENQVKSAIFKDGFKFGTPYQQVFNITNVKAADVSDLKSFFDDNGTRKIGKISISDTMANILNNLDDLETAVKNGVVTDIKVTDASKGSISMAKFNADLDALKKISNTFNLGVTDLAAADAKNVKSPSSYAKLSLSVSDTTANIVKNLSDLNALARSKTLTSVIDSDGAVFALNKAQFDASQDLLNTIRLRDGTDGYRLSLLNFSVSDAAKAASNTHLFKMSISDTTKRILSGWPTIQKLSDNRKIAGLVCNELANTTLSIQDAIKINSVYQASLPFAYTIADSAKNLVAQQNFDFGSILANAKAVTITDKTTPNLEVSQAVTLASISNLTGNTQYNVVDSSENIAAADGASVLKNAKSVSKIDPVTVDQAKAMLALDPAAKYAISDTVDELLAEGAQDKGGILAKAAYVNLVDSSMNFGLHFDAIKALRDKGYLSSSAMDINTHMPLTIQQAFNSYQLFGAEQNISQVAQPYGKSAILDSQYGQIFYKFNPPYLALGTGFTKAYGRSPVSGVTNSGFMDISGSEPGYFALEMTFGTDAQKKADALSIIDRLSSAKTLADFSSALNDASSGDFSLQLKYEITTPADTNRDGTDDLYNHVALDMKSAAGKNGVITINPYSTNWISASLEQPFLGRPSGTINVYDKDDGTNGNAYTVTGNEIGSVVIGVSIPPGFKDFQTLEDLISKATSAATPGAFNNAWNNLNALSNAPDGPSFNIYFDLQDNIDLPGKGSADVVWNYDVVNGHLALKG